MRDVYMKYTLCDCCTEFSQKLKRYQLLLNSIATADMNYNQLDAFLKSQMQKREVSKYS